jgi:hypothetical protein
MLPSMLVRKFVLACLTAFLGALTPVASLKAQQTLPPPANIAGVTALRQAVAERLRFPNLQGWVSVDLAVKTAEDGRIVSVEATLDGPGAKERDVVVEALRRSLLGIQLSEAERSLETSFELRRGQHSVGCYPLTVYVPSTVADTGEPLRDLSLKALRQGVIKWNAIATGYSSGKIVPPLRIVERPEEATVVIVAFEDHPDYSTYLYDPEVGRLVVHVPVKKFLPGLIQSGFRWWHPNIVTEQTMFQLGRILGMPLSDMPGNVMWPGESTVVLPSITGPGNLNSSTRDVQVGYITAGDYISPASAGALGQINAASKTVDPVDVGATDRLITSYQLDDLVDHLKSRTCRVAEGGV